VAAAGLRILLDECVQAGVAEALAADGHDVIRPLRLAHGGESHSGIVVGQQDQNLKRFLRNLRYTLERHVPGRLGDALIWIEKAG
jgi:hypothetical protein